MWEVSEPLTWKTGNRWCPSPCWPYTGETPCCVWWWSFHLRHTHTNSAQWEWDTMQHPALKEGYNVYKKINKQKLMARYLQRSLHILIHRLGHYLLWRKCKMRCWLKTQRYEGWKNQVEKYLYFTFTKISSLDHEVLHYSVKQTSFVVQRLLGALSQTLLTWTRDDAHRKAA